MSQVHNHRRNRSRFPTTRAALLAPQPIGLLPLPRDVREGLLRFRLLLDEALLRGSRIDARALLSCSQKEVLDSIVNYDRMGRER